MTRHYNDADIATVHNALTRLLATHLRPNVDDLGLRYTAATVLDDLTADRNHHEPNPSANPAPASENTPGEAVIHRTVLVATSLVIALAAIGYYIATGSPAAQITAFVAALPGALTLYYAYRRATA